MCKFKCIFYYIYIHMYIQPWYHIHVLLSVTFFSLQKKQCTLQETCTSMSFQFHSLFWVFRHHPTSCFVITGRRCLLQWIPLKETHLSTWRWTSRNSWRNVVGCPGIWLPLQGTSPYLTKRENKNHRLNSIVPWNGIPVSSSKSINRFTFYILF